MTRSRAILLVTSCLVSLLVIGGGVALRVGAADGVYGGLDHFSEVLRLVLDNYVDPLDAEPLLEGAYEGMLGGLEPSDSYLTPQEVKEWLEGGSADQADPGVSVLKAFGSLQVVAVSPGSPAEEVGITVGDQIRRIDGRSLRDLSLEQAIRHLRGRDGTMVQLSVLHPEDAFRREEISVQRARRKDIPWKLEVRGDTAVLAVRDLSRIRAEEISSALATAGAPRLLLDFRNVADGNPREAVRFLSLFVEGELLRLRDRSGQVAETLRGEATGDLWPGPIAVLVNGRTAGGAEAVARVLQTRRGATVYGESTYGWGAEPKLFSLPDGSGMLLSANLWETPSGDTWEGDGVEPDLVLTDSRGSGEADDQLKRAIEAFEKDKESAPASTERKAA